MHPREDRQIHVTRCDIDPLPALSAQRLGGRLQLLAGQPLKHGQIGEGFSAATLVAWPSQVIV
ncbi:hypothetical protein D9M68_823270 [compost metagenome]